MKKSSSYSLMAVLVGWALCAPALASVTFTQAPKADGQRLTFAVSEPTDVEVAVLNAEGKIVRHWAAGMLGADNPPPPPLKPGLAQDMTWDGKDNRGNPVEGGPFSFRVRAGIRGTFDGFPLQNPHSTGHLFTVAVGPGGLVYAFHKHSTANGNMGSHDIKIYDRDARFVRTLKPFAADIPQERVKTTEAFEDEEGRLVPRIHNWQQLGFYPDPVMQRGRSMPDSASPAAVDAKGRVYWVASGTSGPRLVALDPDGGSPYEDFVGPDILPDAINDPDANRNNSIYTHSANLAVSSDGQYVYLAGLVKGWYPRQRRPDPPVVLRISVEDRNKSEVFVGDPDQAGTEGALLTEPLGLATANGLLYVADKKANRVAVFHEKDGSLAGEFAVSKPDTIGVDPESGAVYVLSDPGRNALLIKFDNYTSGEELYRTKLPKANGKQRIAVDASAKPVRIWLPSMHYGPAFTCVEDTGDGFEVLGDPRLEGPRNHGPRDLSYDRIRDELYVKVSGERWHRICGKTHEIKDELFLGAPFRMGAYATQMLAREDGNLVTLSYNPQRAMRLWTRDAQPLNWPGHDSNQGTTWGGIMTFTQNYMALHGDEIFFVPPGHYKTEGKDWRFSSLNVMGYDREERRTAIWQVTRGSIPRIDAKGNIYLATMVRNPQQPLPPFFDDKLPPLPDRLGFSSHYWYSYMYGGIVKFPPEGGSVWHTEGEIPGSVVGAMPEELKNAPKTETAYHYYWNTSEKGSLQNAEWYRSGFAPYSETYPVGTPSCMCEGAGFDVDAWGRVFYPNLGQYRVEFIDNNNNWIGTFGHYGNEDSIGNGQAVETAWQHEGTKRVHPDIPLAWPTYVAVSDTHAYVNDTLSRRVVAVRLDAELSETVAMK